jgi:dipeptidyl-peptidase 4
MAGPESFPRQYARTRRFTCGEPRGYRINADGDRVVFLRSLGGDDPVNRLWCLDRQADGRWLERLLVDPLALDLRADGSLPAAELARRERLREQASGITAFDVDGDAANAVFALNGTLVVANLDDTTLHTLAAKPGGYDPRLSPDGETVAYVSDRCLRAVSARTGSSDDRLLIGEHDDNVSWGIVDFVAAEELNRYRGFWWSPDSTHLLAERIDVTPVNMWTIADPTHPERTPTTHRYPAAGTANALLSLAVIDATTGARTDITWDESEFCYLVEAQWTKHGLTLTLLDRAQRHLRIIDADPSTGRLRRLHDVHDDPWVELAAGAPLRLADDVLVLTADLHVHASSAPGLATPIELDSYVDPEGTRALVLVRPGVPGHTILSPANLQIRRIVGVEGDRVLAIANASRPVDALDVPADPATTCVVGIALDGSSPVHVVAGSTRDPGVHDITSGAGLHVLRATSLDRLRAEHVLVDGSKKTAIGNSAEAAAVAPRPTFFRAGPRAIPCCLFFPTDAERFGDTLTKLPVIMDPYGGPHAARVVASRNAHASSQWLADQGFIVIVADGRGTPAIGPRWEREIHGDFAGPVLEDQITALHEAAQRYPQIDLTRVGIRGWSFGGYLAALAVLRAPEVFHAAVAGAPVTDWGLYDTGYTERYLGLPSEQPAAYERSSLFPLAAGLRRPLLLIHGLADDNVVAAHTLQLSSRLLAAGRQHSVLPLSGVTHMTPQEEVAENLLLLQVDFLRHALG